VFHGQLGGILADFGYFMQATPESPAATEARVPVPEPAAAAAPSGARAPVTEIGGPEGPEPTRYGDWERKGRCIDF